MKISEFTHSVETSLGEMRNGSLRMRHRLFGQPLRGTVHAAAERGGSGGRRRRAEGRIDFAIAIGKYGAGVFAVMSLEP